MKKKPEAGLDRRSFLKASAGAGLVSTGLAHGQEQAAPDSPAPPPPPTHAQEAAEHSGDAYTPEQEARWFVDNPGSDFMVDVIKQLDMDYMALNPGSTFRGLQESIVNYGGNRKPELVTVNHEGIGVSMAQGYFKAAGKMMSVLVHGSVGLQHTPMGIYSAWCDRVPMIVLVGNHNDAAERSNQNNWLHSAADLPALVRDFTKWDDTCLSLGHFAQSMTRAYKIAMTPPMGPVVIVIDAENQENAIEGETPRIPKLSTSVPPQGDQNALDELADWLVDAEQPMFVAERMAHDQRGIDRLVELAELLEAGVIDGRARVNFPTEHHLFQDRAALALADVIVGLEVTGPVTGNVKSGVKVATIGMDQYPKANFQNFEEYFAPDLTIVGDAQASLPYLTEAVRERIGSVRKSKLGDREQFWRERHMSARESAMVAAARGWDHAPVTTARMYMETYNAIKSRDWSMVSLDRFQSSWANRIWPINKYHQFHGSSGSAAIGYGAPASVGAALGHKEAGRLAVNFQRDGDLMFYPGALWTAAHHNIPLLSVMHNNRAYHAETMIVQRTAAERRRGLDGSSRIGTVMDDPAIDFAGLAKSLGVWSTDTITDPKDLAPALKKALEVIDAGEPALLDVFCPGR